MIREVLGRLKWPTLMLSWSEKSDSFELIGRQGIQFGDTVFEYGPLALAAKLGLVLVINEIDRGRAGDLVALNDVLDGGNLVIKETGEVIEPHANFRVICTANSAGSGDLTGQYVGSVRRLDPAFLDRFAMIRVGYMEQSDELDLLMLQFPDYARKSSHFLTKLTSFAMETRSKAVDVAEPLSNPISTRALMRTLNLGRSMGLLRRIGESDFLREGGSPSRTRPLVSQPPLSGRARGSGYGSRSQYGLITARDTLTGAIPARGNAPLFPFRRKQ